MVTPPTFVVAASRTQPRSSPVRPSITLMPLGVSAALRAELHAYALALAHGAGVRTTLDVRVGLVGAGDASFVVVCAFVACACVSAVSGAALRGDGPAAGPGGRHACDAFNKLTAAAVNHLDAVGWK
eukprot:6209402-Pleurochrysis_carterae.AAC.4